MIPSKRKYERMDINRLEKKLRKTILKSANQNIGRKKINQHTRPWMTPEIKAAITTRNQLRKTVSQNRKEWIEACRSTAEMITQRKREVWKEYVEGITISTDPKQVWRTIRGMDGRRPPDNNNEVLEVNGKTYVEDIDKAREFAKTYKSFSKIPMKKEDRILRKGIRKRMKRKPQAAQESEQDFTWEELERTIEESKNNKAAGEDDIPYEFIKHLGPNAKQLLLHLYNRCWEGEGIPTKWRTAIIKPLLKGGKDPKLTVSYRPISLTACMGKLLEKMVADRMLHILEDRNILNDNQAGFRPNRCTTDQILKLVQQASDQMHSSNNPRTYATFFDYEKAYDKVWRDGLLFKMQALNIPDRFIRYVRHFLSGRKTRVEVNGVRSETFRLDQGLPQGSSISPLLFLIFINDIDVDLHADTIASLFADDTATWMKDGKVRGSNKVLVQEEIDKILSWAERWKMQVNEGKTKAMIFSTSKADTEWDPKLKAGGKEIDLVKQYPFLGVTVDSGLRFSTYITEVIKKSRKRVNIIRCLSSRDWGNSLESQRMLYITYIRSVLEYASSSWSPWIADTNLQKLQVIQNAALRSVAGLYKTCPEDFLHLETGVKPLKYRYEDNDDITWDRYARLPEYDQRRQLQVREAPIRLKTRLGWRKKTSDRMSNINIHREISTPNLPPWRKLVLSTDKVPLEKPKADYSEEELLQISTEKIKSINREVTIFTDGSTDEKQENGGAGVYVEDRSGVPLYEASFAAGKLCSSYTGECVAFLRALEWLQQNLRDALICTDSLSLHSALEGNNYKDRDPWLKEIKKSLFDFPVKVTLLWIPSHCNIPGNERADELAKMGSEMSQNNIPVTHAIMKAKIKAKRWPVKHQRAKDIFGATQKPRFKIEGKWPKHVRSLYSRLRTDHAMELKSYRLRLGKEEDAICEKCGLEDETIKHILCKCPVFDRKRRELWQDEKIDVSDLVKEPDKCRQLLELRFEELKLPESDESGSDDE